MRDTKIQWHSGFVAAMNLEFDENKDDLEYEKEYNLNTKPLQVDLLIIKKNTDTIINNDIGKIFRRYNVLEYKSPEDSLDIDTIYKAQAYACLYKCYGDYLDERKADEITVSILRESKPRSLFHYFKEHGIKISNPYKGIYYILDNVLFPTQIVVTKEFDRETHTWLRSLSSKLEEGDMRELLEYTMRLKGKREREYADSVLDVSIKANENLVEFMRGDGSMSEALLEVVEPLIEPMLTKRKQEGYEQGIKQGIERGIEQGIEQGIERGIEQGIEQGIERGIEQGIEQGIIFMIDVLRDLGRDDTEIKSTVAKKYGMPEEKLEKYF